MAIDWMYGISGMEYMIYIMSLNNKYDFRSRDVIKIGRKVRITLGRGYGVNVGHNQFNLLMGHHRGSIK